MFHHVSSVQFPVGPSSRDSRVCAFPGGALPSSCIVRNMEALRLQHSTAQRPRALHLSRQWSTSTWELCTQCTLMTQTCVVGLSYQSDGFLMFPACTCKRAHSLAAAFASCQRRVSSLCGWVFVACRTLRSQSKVTATHLQFKKTSLDKHRNFDRVR